MHATGRSWTPPPQSALHPPNSPTLQVYAMLEGAAGCTIWILDVRTEPHLLVGRTRFGSLVKVSAKYCCRSNVSFGKNTVAHGIQRPLLVISCVSTVMLVMTSPGPVVINELMAAEKATCRQGHRPWTQVDQVDCYSPRSAADEARWHEQLRNWLAHSVGAGVHS